MEREGERGREGERVKLSWRRITRSALRGIPSHQDLGVMGGWMGLHLQGQPLNGAITTSNGVGSQLADNPSYSVDHSEVMGNPKAGKKILVKLDIREEEEEK